MHGQYICAFVEKLYKEYMPRCGIAKGAPELLASAVSYAKQGDFKEAANYLNQAGNLVMEQGEHIVDVDGLHVGVDYNVIGQVLKSAAFEIQNELSQQSRARTVDSVVAGLYKPTKGDGMGIYPLPVPTGQPLAAQPPW